MAPLFPMEIWNVRQRTLDGLPRTQNPVEAFHLAMQQGTATHPSLWSLINELKNEEALAKMKVQQFIEGRGVKAQRKCYASQNIRLKSLIEKYPTYKDRLKHLRAIGHTIKLNV